MPRTRRQMKRNSPPIETNENQPKKKKAAIKLKSKACDESSSDSDIENYLKPASEIDLNSTFFKTTAVEKTSFEDIENDIFSGINRLSDSESNDDLEQNEPLENSEHISCTKPSSSRSIINFDHIHAYNKKLEEAKKQIEAYKARKEIEEKNVDILNMLTVGESKPEDNISAASLYSSEYETVSDSEKEDWEEVHTVEENTLIPKKGLQITVQLQENVRKKKGVDLMDIIKRRLNRVKKENQVFLHKVHLLCWIAHGNYVNKILSSENLMSLALSLLPSQHCYPPQRLNLSYIEDILQWYRKAVKVKERPVDITEKTEDMLEQQIAKKECYDYKMFVYIFVCILRSLGIRCRLVLSLQVESLRPPSSELCSLSKTPSNTTKTKDRKSANTSVLQNQVKTPKRSKKRQTSVVVSTKKTKHVEKKTKAKPRNLEMLNKVNVEDVCVSLLQQTEYEKAHQKEGKQSQKPISRSMNKKEKDIVKNSNSQETSSNKQGKGLVHKKEANRPRKENKSISTQINGNKTTEKPHKTVKNKSTHNNNQGETSKNYGLNLQKTTKQKKVDTSKMNSLTEPKIENPNNYLRSSGSQEDISHISHKSAIHKTCEQSKDSTQDNNNKIAKISALKPERNNKSSKTQAIKNSEMSESKEVSNKIKNIKNECGNLTKNLQEEHAIKPVADLKNKEKSISSRRSRNLVSQEETNIKDNTQRNKSPQDTKSENIEKSTTARQSRVSVDTNESGVKKQNQKLLKIKLPLKLKSPTEKPQESIIKQRIGSVPSTVINKENETEAAQKTILQLDGGNDTDDSDVESSKPKVKANLKKLKNKSVNQCLTKDHPQRLRKPVKYKEINSDEDFYPRGSSTSKNSDSSDKKTNIKSNPKNISQKMDFKKLKSQREKSNSQTSSDSDKSKYFGTFASGKLDVRNDIINLVKQSFSMEKEMLRSKLVKHKRVSRPYSSESDSDYIPEPTKKRTLQDDFKEKQVKVKRRIPMKKDLIEMEKKRQIEKEEEKKKRGINVWVEIFTEAEEKWISVDVVKGQVHCVKEIYTRATHPISYILSWDNGNYIKDITKRYCLNWNTVTRKLRVDPKWWEATLLPYKSQSNVRDREEDEDLARQQLEQPLPTTISEYKNHPLYVLKRHILKFEAIYPPDAVILGFVRNEPVYSRDCVHVLHSREIWLKHAKVVKPGETPYKIVKARPKYDKLSNSVITDQPLEIFGKWQVEDYVPPTAENGVVPRNAYGNVELFKSCMLPKGTVHLQLPGLNKVAKKMDIDCAPAVVGFDFHGGWSHPTFDGFVVCEEYSEQLIAAWYEEQEESERKAQEKIEKRVYDNWKRLIKGLLIRERLKAKYDFGEVSSKDGKTKKKGLTLKKRKIHSESDSE